MQKNITTIVSRNIKDMANARGMTMAAISESTGLHYQTIYNVFHGRTKVRVPTLSRIAEALSCDINQLITGAERSMVKEAREVYATKNSKAHTVNDAVRVLAEQFGVDERELKRRILELVLKMEEN